MESLLGPENLQALRSLTIYVPNHLSLSEVETLLLSGSSGQASRHESALTLASHLLDPGFVGQDNKDASAIAKLVAEHLLSPGTAASDAEISALTSEAGIACLHLLSSLPSSCTFDDATVLKLVAFTDEQDPWTTEKAYSVAWKILSTHPSKERMQDLVLGPVLQGFLKPLFAKSSSRVTESGRPDRYYGTTDPRNQQARTASWKTSAPWAIATTRWAVERASETIYRNNWPLFTPAILALAEDESDKVRFRGLQILTIFIMRCPPAVLRTTGIGLVIEEVCFAALLHLPSITPEDDSVKVLTWAFRALIKIAHSYGQVQGSSSRELLDKMLREGVFEAYSHASQYPRIVEVLLDNMQLIIEDLGIHVTKHLKAIISILSSVMEDPFATAYPPAIIAATKAAQTTVTTCWPRLLGGANFEQIIRSLSLCWLNLCEDADTPRTDDEASVTISKALLETARRLGAIWDRKHTARPEGMSELFRKDPRLVNLFPAFLG